VEYAGPTSDPQTFTSHALPALPIAAQVTSSEEVDLKTAFLAALRESVSDMQNTVNVFLTCKMDEDRAREDEARTGSGGGAKPRQTKEEEEKKEEMYGEENPEAD